ncbi:hypothetical protein CSB45_13610 [candidate division KSB3 bacterium]|uniref:Uncharacterized protein n=1 Tax=candidate division KSB3 bacterium TaxID=2044937 RepID=A0A2G6E1M8_9BACT|nr:MAG: hypothetical protein CSB45_13610 [candidate division KSB3 bacterium]PIE28596.1 MAG: hypothetical protein CSA57_13260 [candidate division KSB3 bacterium]
MFKKIDWKALLLGAVVKFVAENVLNALLFVIFGTYMHLVLGASPWWIFERFQDSPVGLLSSTFATLVAYWLLGFVAGHVAKRSPFSTVGVYLVIEVFFSLLSLGLNIPHSARIDFWESLILLFCVIVAYVGVLSNERIVKDHARF